METIENTSPKQSSRTMTDDVRSAVEAQIGGVVGVGHVVYRSYPYPHHSFEIVESDGRVFNVAVSLNAERAPSYGDAYMHDRSDDPNESIDNYYENMDDPAPAFPGDDPAEDPENYQDGPCGDH